MRIGASALPASFLCVAHGASHDDGEEEEQEQEQQQQQEQEQQQQQQQQQQRRRRRRQDHDDDDGGDDDDGDGDETAELLELLGGTAASRSRPPRRPAHDDCRTGGAGASRPPTPSLGPPPRAPAPPRPRAPASHAPPLHIPSNPRACHHNPRVPLVYPTMPAMPRTPPPPPRQAPEDLSLERHFLLPISPLYLPYISRCSEAPAGRPRKWAADTRGTPGVHMMYAAQQRGGAAALVRDAL